MKPSIVTFPKDSLWGAATAAYQIEGTINQGGNLIRFSTSSFRVSSNVPCSNCSRSLIDAEMFSRARFFTPGHINPLL